MFVWWMTITCTSPNWIPYDTNREYLNGSIPDYRDDATPIIFISLDGINFIRSDITFGYYVPVTPVPTPGPDPDTPLVWIQNHLWVPILGGFGVLIIIVVSLWVAISHRKDEGYVELTQVAQEQELGAAVVIKASELSVKKTIGRGQFSDVYNGIYRFTEVAIKRLRQVGEAAVVEELIKEARVMQQLRHPNVVAFMGISCMDKTDLCLITEFLPRGSLWDVITNPNIKIEPEHKRRMCLDCCCGMDYLHSKNLIHRDLSPKIYWWPTTLKLRWRTLVSPNSWKTKKQIRHSHHAALPYFQHLKFCSKNDIRLRQMFTVLELFYTRFGYP
eukprot:TRINITY_DN4347_c0_g1_i2.p1 TRINITY_DN4347_c0_g1~~TRINITY_DN4347_c0_g1_i2.p1  ORF type:complete len:330 (+),score=34.85 TRINITY_DN4347_c0_g1_i2:617-1606(+)